MTLPIDTNLVPTSKVTAAAIAGAIVTVITWAAQQYGHVQLDPVVQGALTTLVTVLAGYLKIEKSQ